MPIPRIARGATGTAELIATFDVYGLTLTWAIDTSPNAPWI